MPSASEVDSAIFEWPVHTVQVQEHCVPLCLMEPGYGYWLRLCSQVLQAQGLDTLLPPLPLSVWKSLAPKMVNLGNIGFERQHYSKIPAKTAGLHRLLEMMLLKAVMQQGSEGSVWEQ